MYLSQVGLVSRQCQVYGFRFLITACCTPSVSPSPRWKSNPNCGHKLTSILPSMTPMFDTLTCSLGTYHDGLVVSMNTLAHYNHWWQYDTRLDIASKLPDTETAILIAYVTNMNTRMCRNFQNGTAQLIDGNMPTSTSFTRFLFPRPLTVHNYKPRFYRQEIARHAQTRKLVRLLCIDYSLTILVVARMEHWLEWFQSVVSAATAIFSCRTESSCHDSPIQCNVRQRCQRAMCTRTTPGYRNSKEM